MNGDVRPTGSVTAFVERLTRRYRGPAGLSARLSGFMTYLGERVRHAPRWAVVEPSSGGFSTDDLVYARPPSADSPGSPILRFDDVPHRERREGRIAPLPGATPSDRVTTGIPSSRHHDPAGPTRDRPSRGIDPSPHIRGRLIQPLVPRAREGEPFRAHEPSIRPFRPMIRPHVGAVGIRSPRPEGRAYPAGNDRMHIRGRTPSPETGGDRQERRQNERHPVSLVPIDQPPAHAGLPPDGRLRDWSIELPHPRQAATRDAAGMPAAGMTGRPAGRTHPKDPAPARVDSIPSEHDVAGRGFGPGSGAAAHGVAGALDRTDPFDLQKLADRVYRLIADRLRRERDMRGR